VRDLFSRGECQGESLIAICHALAAANARCSDYTFGVERATKIRFRGKEICIILGDVGSLVADSKGGSGWSCWRSVYALAVSENQTKWMQANSDAFSPACETPNFPEIRVATRAETTLLTFATV
jgi:hypothetical protein